MSKFLRFFETQCIVIVGERRLSNFVAGLTNDNPTVKAPVYKQYHHVQYNGTVPVYATVSVSFPPTLERYRYVIIQKKFSHTEAICMAEVKVYLRGMRVFGSAAQISIPTVFV